jgi:hypothetical protein
VAWGRVGDVSTERLGQSLAHMWDLPGRFLLAH